MSDKRNMFYGAAPQIFENAKKLRDNMTKHELLLWEKLKSNKFMGLRFKAQHPIATYIADFYCHKIKLVIEIDGATHDSIDAKEYDMGRRTEMEEFGIKTIRFSNNLIESDLSQVLKKIESVCTARANEMALIFTPTLKGESDSKQSIITSLKGASDSKQPLTPTLKGEADFGSIESPLKGVGVK
jgi:very-short-patch-repair endonuclease